jgi:hypothetical protein
VASRETNLLRQVRRGICDASSLPRQTLPVDGVNVSTKTLSRPCLLLSLVVLAFVFAPGPTLSAATLSPSDVEAAYLYNFGKFIGWPPPSDATAAPFSICVVGKDDFGATLDSLIQNDTINGRTIVAKRLPSISVADACQILFLGSSEEPRLAKDLDAIKEKPILTVSSIPGFLDRGGMIQFLVRDSRVRFAVNLDSSTRAHLSLSSELLKVAVLVKLKPVPEGQ